MAKNKPEGYLSAKESRRISRENRRITNQFEKERKRKNVPESEYTTTMHNPENAVEFDNLHTYFFTDAGTVKSVDGVSFEVPIGKTVGVVGESGCGTSVTSLSLMQLIQRPQGQIVEGEIRLNLGNDKAYNIVKTPNDKMKDLRGNYVSMIFQEPMTSLNPVFRIGEQVDEVIGLHEERSKEDLGRFGLGLKTASLSQCRVLTVVTKIDDLLLAKRWDIDYVSKTGKWSLLILDSNEIQEIPNIEQLMKYKTGTLVIWQKLDRLKTGEINFEQELGRKIGNVREHLSLVYHRYLFGETGIRKLTIKINNMEVEPVDPFLTSKSVQVMDDEILIIRGKKIEVRPYLLPHISKMTSDEIKVMGGKEGLRKRQGFYVYRNKRLLVWGTWFRMMRQGETSKLARIRVDIPNDLDDLWTLDIKKSSAIPPAEVRNNLKSIIEKLADKSKRTWTYRGKKELDDSVVHVWIRYKTRAGGFIYEINREYPLLVQIQRENIEIANRLSLLMKQIEENIPLNSLYLDLINDEKVENERDKSSKEIILTLQEILKTADNSIHNNLLETLKKTEPFCNFIIEIDQAIKEGKLQ